MEPFDVFQVGLVVLLAFLVANYLYAKWSLKKWRETEIQEKDVEGFSNPDGEEPDTNITILGNDLLFDEFYAKIYDKIVDGQQRQDAEVNLTLAWAKKYRPENKAILALDVGCGTGNQVELFRKAGIGKAVGFDKSLAMVERGRKLFPKADLREGDAEIIGQFAAGEFNLATLYYFTYYYLRDRTVALKNIHSWLQTGGVLVIHVVNREKFDPILETASPFLAFSIQKYAKDRITRSRVAFDKFDYDANFTHKDALGEFTEVFTFKGGKRRKQVHSLRMPSMAQIVAEVESCGFKYKEYIDLMAIGYEYQYLFCFIR